jgi:hypothetical protein
VLKVNKDFAIDNVRTYIHNAVGDYMIAKAQNKDSSAYYNKVLNGYNAITDANGLAVDPVIFTDVKGFLDTEKPIAPKSEPSPADPSKVKFTGEELGKVQKIMNQKIKSQHQLFGGAVDKFVEYAKKDIPTLIEALTATLDSYYDSYTKKTPFNNSPSSEDVKFVRGVSNTVIQLKNDKLFKDFDLAKYKSLYDKLDLAPCHSCSYYVNLSVPACEECGTDFE